MRAEEALPVAQLLSLGMPLSLLVDLVLLERPGWYASRDILVAETPQRRSA